MAARRIEKDTDDQQVIVYLRHLFAYVPGNLIELRAIPKQRGAGGKIHRLWTSSPSEIIDFIEKYSPDRYSEHQVYFGMVKRTCDGGKKEHCGSASALWADIDCLTHGWDIDETMRAVYKLPQKLRPSAIIKSGGGIHCVWYLDRASIETVGTNHKRIEDANTILGELVSGDSVHNIDRILRLPGSWNTKRGSAKAAMCEVVYTNGNARFNIHELLDAALEFGKVLDGRDFVAPSAAKLKPAPTVKPDDKTTASDGYARAIEAGNRQVEKDLDRLWRDRVRYHAPRGYVGIDYATLITTARLHCKGWTDDAIVYQTMKYINAVDKDGEQWNMKEEERKIRRQLARWKPTWSALKQSKASATNQKRGVSTRKQSLAVDGQAK